MSGKARRVIFGALIVVAWAVPGVSTPVAAEAMSCTAEGDFTANPGLSTTPSSGSFASEPAALNCKGIKGTMTFAGNYGTKDPDTCSSGGEGTSTNTYKFTDGTVTDEVEFTYGPFQGGALGGRFEGKRSSGTFEVTSIEGDCVSKPLTTAHAVFRNVVVER